ncbi:glycosyltransferase family 39 protein [Jatrophihabitans sp. YIM 134969]
MVEAPRPRTARTAPAAHSPLLLVALFLAATVVAIVPAWHVSLWYDEAASVSAAERSVGHLLDLTRNTNAAQGVYYLLLHVWTAVAGTSPTALRAPSAVAIGLAAVGVVVLARRAYGPGTALLAGVVFAVLPRVTWAGIEARPYALTAAVAVWLTVLAVTAADGGFATRRTRLLGWAAYAVLAGFGVALFVYLALLVVVHGALLLLGRGRTTPAAARAVVLSWLAAAVVGAVLAAPVVLRSSGQTSQLGIASKLSLPDLARSLVVTEWFLGDTPTPVTAALRPSSPSAFTVTWSVAAVALALVGWALVLVALTRRADGRLDLRWWLVLWIAVPALVIGLYSVAVAPMYVPRYLTFATPALAILVARGGAVLATRTRRGAVVVLAVAVVLAAPVYVSQRTAFAKNSTDWSALAAYVEDHARAGEGVYFAPRGAVPAGKPVTTTMRTVETAYPDAFRGLVDVTQLTTGAADGSLWGTSARLSDARDRLDGLPVVWVVRRLDESAADIAAEDAVLTDAGFAGSEVWRGPSDAVYRFDRR